MDCSIVLPLTTGDGERTVAPWLDARCVQHYIVSHEGHHFAGQSSLGVASAIANLCGGTCSALGHARRVASMSPWLLNAASGGGLQSKRNNILHTVSLFSSGLTTVARHIPLTSPWNSTNIVYCNCSQQRFAEHNKYIQKPFRFTKWHYLLNHVFNVCSYCATRDTPAMLLPT